MLTAEDTKAKEFFDNKGLRLLTPLEESTFIALYRAEMIRGLHKEASSLRMYRTLLQPVTLSSVTGTAAVVEIGGSNLYSAIISVTSGKTQVVKRAQTSLGTRVFESAENFYELIATHMEEVLEGQTVDALGIVFSFAATPIKISYGVDLLSTRTLPKGFIIPGIEERLVGEALKIILHKRFGLPLDLPTAVMNDTPAVLFSAGAQMGGVVGTGFNISFATPEGIVNSESGGFKTPFSNVYADKVDAESLRPGHSQEEKQISGLYLGLQLRIIIEELGVTGYENANAETISLILGKDALDPKEKTLQMGAALLRDRSAQLVGLMMGTVFKAFPEQFKEDLIKIPVEGSVFWKMPGYKDKTQEVAERVGEKKIEFLNIPDAGRVGAGVAALSVVKGNP